MTTIKISNLPPAAGVTDSTVIPVVDSGTNKKITGAQIKNYVSSVVGGAGSTGPRGPAGPAGATGETGPAGATGASGASGLRGASGSIGFTGPEGATGPQGPAGVIGPQGPAGAIGATGAQGPQGIQGPAGANGADGADGAQGPQGIQGPAGANGADGATGAQGPAGADGAQGPQGIQGPAGANGADGATGAQGPAGADGATGAQGPAGADGTSVRIIGSVADAAALAAYNTSGIAVGDGLVQIDTGHLQVWTGAVWTDVGNITGPAGATGPQGNTGTTGSQGPAGEVGATGAQGDVGATGPAGEVGATGPAGANGVDGAQGPAGATGEIGATGAQGPVGPAGSGSGQSIGFNFNGGSGNTLGTGTILNGGDADDEQDITIDAGLSTETYTQNILSPVAITGDYNDLVNVPVEVGQTNAIVNTDEYNTYSVTVSDNGIVTMNTARGSLEFGAQPEPGAPSHLHIMRPEGQENDLFFGDDYNYVKLPGMYNNSPLGVEIGSSLDQGAANTWRFGTDGDLVLPAGKTIRDTSGVDLFAGGDTEAESPAYKGFKAHYGRMWGNNSGPINKIVIYKDTATPSSSIDASTEDDTFTVAGLSNSDVVVMLVAIGEDENQTVTAELKTFAESIIDNVILAGGAEGNINTAADMKSAFYDNFATFSSILTDLKVNFQFFGGTNSPQYNINNFVYNGTTGTGASFGSLQYSFANSGFETGSWSNGTGYVVGDTFTILGTDIVDGTTGQPLASPDNDTTITVASINGGYLNTFTIASGIPVPADPGPNWPSNNIDDGGNDEYDGGNYITTNLEAEISYNGGNVVSGSSAFGGGDYVVTYQDSIFGIFAVNSAADSISTQGGSGFDGDGQADTGSLYGAANSGVNIGDFVFSGSTLTATDDNLYIKAVDDLWLDALDDDVHIRANDDVRIKAGHNFQEDESQSEWRFTNDGNINFPDGSTQSTAWTGLFSYNNLNDRPSVPNDVNQLADSSGLLTNTTVAMAGAILPSMSGVPTGLQGPMLDLTDGTYGPFDRGGVIFEVVVTNGGISDYINISSSGVYTINDVIGTIGSGELGGVPGVTTTNISVVAVQQPQPTQLDTTRTINKLSEGNYVLPDGEEGQIRYLVRQTAETVPNIEIRVTNARVGVNFYTNYPLYFNNDIITLIYTDGAWSQSGGSWD